MKRLAKSWDDLLFCWIIYEDFTFAVGAWLARNI